MNFKKILMLAVIVLGADFILSMVEPKLFDAVGIKSSGEAFGMDDVAHAILLAIIIIFANQLV